MMQMNAAALSFLFCVVCAFPSAASAAEKNAPGSSTSREDQLSDLETAVQVSQLRANYRESYELLKAAADATGKLKLTPSEMRSVLRNLEQRGALPRLALEYLLDENGGLSKFRHDWANGADRSMDWITRQDVAALKPEPGLNATEQLLQEKLAAELVHTFSSWSADNSQDIGANARDTIYRLHVKHVQAHTDRREMAWGWSGERHVHPHLHMR